MYLHCGPFQWPRGRIGAIWIQHDQGFTGSLWTPPSGDHSLRITPAAARATFNKTTMQNLPTLLAVLMAITMQWYYTAHIAWWRRFVAFLKATKRHHRVSTCSNKTNWTCQHQLYLRFYCEKGLELTCWSIITIVVWHIKLMKCT